MKQLTKAETKELARIEAITDADTRALEYMEQVDTLLKATPPGETPDLPLFLRGKDQAARNAAWEAHVKEHGYKSSKAFFAEKEKRALDPSTEKFLATLAAAEAKALAEGITRSGVKAVKRQAGAQRNAQRAGAISVQDIATELKILPRDARAILRKAKVPKPDIGWAGDEAWAAGIRKVLTDAPARAPKGKGEAHPPRGKRSKRVPLQPGDLVGSNKSKHTRQTSAPPDPKYKNPIERHHGEQLTTPKPKKKKVDTLTALVGSTSTHKVKIDEVLKGQGKRGAKVATALKAAKKGKRK